MDQKEQILFSIIIPTHNRANMISKAIQSVIDQTYGNWELIIIDDGSTDNTEEVVKNFRNERINYFKKEHEERSIARNYGIERANGMYICFLDDDDYLLLNYFETFSKLISEKGFPVSVFICNAYIEIDGAKKMIQKIPEGITTDPILAIWKEQPGITQMMIHKSILLYERFEIRFPYGEDFHLWIRIAINYSFFEVNEILCVFINHLENGTKKKFESHVYKNAMLSIEFIDDLLIRFQGKFKTHYSKYITDWRNHQIYGFASAALKKGDFLLFKQLFQELKYNGTKKKTIYYLLSLTLRFPFYWIRFFIKKLLKSTTLIFY